MFCTMIIFGASGDLTRRKLIPALYQLHRKQRLPEGFRVVGFSRTEYSHATWRDALAESTAQLAGNRFDTKSWSEFAPVLHYIAGDLNRLDDLHSLQEFLDKELDGCRGERVFYLATAPRFYERAIVNLGKTSLAASTSQTPRIVIEKPFGTDLASARELNDVVHQVFPEDQVYRIDHYLGKETVQNILVLRLANSIFEPVWNRNYVDHVQITVAEEVAVGSRGGYYDSAGVLRDMIQNHLLQLLMVTAMEAPVRFRADPVRNEKVKVLEAIRPLRGSQVACDTVRGQYAGYRNEPDVASDSQTATFAAVKLWIDNWRWQGVPFYLRSGKAMSCRTTQIVVQFQAPPHMLFAADPRRAIDANRLVIQVQPAEGIQLHFQTKVPDSDMQLRQTDLAFNFQEQFPGTMPGAYERLLLDALEGDASLFARADEVELAWGIVDPILTAWEETGTPELSPYPRGQWGPEECTEWMGRQGRQWFDACPVLH
jgi:glucose-6-phosphate 1-dehydrogenase